MTLILHRYIFRELLRVFLLATIALTLILSLGGILRPVQQYGVGPRQVLDILLYFMPITLTFVLPMAALFASALTYGRFASDNELDACRASGISIGTLVYPGLILALLVAIANLLLSFHVMPYFVHRAEKAFKADAKLILFRNIQRRGYYGLPGDRRYYIYADDVDPEDNALFGVVAIQAQDGRVGRIVTAEATRVQFDPHDRYNEVQLLAYNAWQMGAAANDLWGHVGAISVKQEFGSLLGDDIKFKRLEEMKQIRGNLLLFEPVARAARAARVQLATELLARDISTGLPAGPASFYELQGVTRTIRLSAQACALGEQGVITLVPPIALAEYEAATGKYVRRLQCEKADLRVEGEAADLRVSLDVRNARIEETGQLLIQYGLVDLALPEPIRRTLSGRPLLPLGAAAEAVEAPSPAPGALSDKVHLLEQLQNALRLRIQWTLTDIKSEMNSRLVFGIGCIPMILIGIALGIRHKGGHLLSAFGASCMPGVVLVVAIISGKHVTENSRTQGPVGVLIMWAGLGFLILLTAFFYRKLRRT